MMRRWTLYSLDFLVLLACLAGCGPAPTMGSPVSGGRFEESMAGQVFSFRLPDGVQAEVQFQPGGTVVYRGGPAGLDGVGRWRPSEKGGWMPCRRRGARFPALPRPASAHGLPLAARTAGGRQARGMREEPRAVGIGGRGSRGELDAVGHDGHDVVRGAW